MRLAVFTKSTTFHKGFGGFETQNKVLCENLAKRGHDITVFSPKKELEIFEKTENLVKYVFIPCRFGRFSSLYSADKESWEHKAYEVFARYHGDKHFDLVVGQSSWALPIIRKKNKLDLKVVSILHGTKMGEFQTELRDANSISDLIHCLIDIPHTLRAFFITQRDFVRCSNKLIAVSNYVKSSIVDETYIPENKVVVIHNGIDNTKFLSCGNDEQKSEPVKIIYIGRVIKVKGLYVLLEALSKLADLKFQLEVVGGGKDKENLVEFTKLKGLSDRVTFAGQIKYEEIAEKLCKADIFVIPTLRVEGFPMTIVEAMFAGLPVVASDIGGNSDAVVDGQTGFLIKPGSIEELQKRLTELVQNSQKRIEMGNSGRSKALNEFTIDRMLDGYEKVFKEVLK